MESVLYIIVDQAETTLTDLAIKHPGKPAYKGFYPLAKHIFQDDGEIVTESIVLDNAALEVLRAKIKAILIDELPPKKS